MATIAVVSFRLGGTDGVSIEAAKWIGALEHLGHEVRTVAGAGSVDVVLPGLAIGAAHNVTFDELSDTLKNVDLVIVENLASLPLNVHARDVLYDVLHNRAAVFHHHDLSWQRPHLAHLDGPRDEERWHHVTINQLSQDELQSRGIEAVTIMNSFDCDPPSGDRDATRQALDISEEILLLLPTRAIPRKNVRGALALAESLGATLWILGPAEDGFDDELDSLLSAATCPLRRGLPRDCTIHDAYAASDAVVMPSTWEGFGNPVLESVTHRRPLALNAYPVAKEITAFGFRFFDLTDAEGLRQFIASPEDALFEQNLNVARQHFNVANLPAQLEALLARTGVQ